MRLFIAVIPPPSVQMAAYHAADPLRTSRDAVAWVKRDNLHYTMRFLGECEPGAVERAKNAMRDAVGASLGGFGAFPNAKSARVLWIGTMQGAEPMRLLASALEEALVRHGFEPADQDFEPHLTVGRVRTPGDWTTRLLDVPTVESRFQVDRLHLVKSTLASGGSRYEPLVEEKLAR